MSVIFWEKGNDSLAVAVKSPVLSVTLRFQESSWITSLARCALCWTISSSGACPDSSTRAKAFWTVVSLAPPRRPSTYCSSTGNFSSGIWKQETELSGTAGILPAWRLRFVIELLTVNRVQWRIWRFQSATTKDFCHKILIYNVSSASPWYYECVSSVIFSKCQLSPRNCEFKATGGFVSPFLSQICAAAATSAWSSEISTACGFEPSCIDRVTKGCGCELYDKRLRVWVTTMVSVKTCIKKIATTSEDREVILGFVTVERSIVLIVLVLYCYITVYDSVTETENAQRYKKLFSLSFLMKSEWHHWAVTKTRTSLTKRDNPRPAEVQWAQTVLFWVQSFLPLWVSFSLPFSESFLVSSPGPSSPQDSGLPLRRAQVSPPYHRLNLKSVTAKQNHGSVDTTGLLKVESLKHQLTRKL